MMQRKYYVYVNVNMSRVFPGNTGGRRCSRVKGGRGRTVPITTPEQRTVLDEAHRLAGMGSLIPSHKIHIQRRD